MRLSRCISTETEASIVKGHDMTTPSEDYRLIPLTQGQFAKVDSADYEWISQWKWCAHWRESIGSYYAVRHDYGSGRQSTIYMHRLILGLVSGQNKHGDHVNHDTLDNRRVNVRVASSQENQRNRRTQKNNTSGFKGVKTNKNGTFVAQIRHAGKLIHIGTFPNAICASEAYLKLSAELHGEFALHKVDAR